MYFLAKFIVCVKSLCDPQQVLLQTQQEVKTRMVGMAVHVVRNDGVLALYSGLSASMCRQVCLFCNFFSSSASKLCKETYFRNILTPLVYLHSCGTMCELLLQNTFLHWG